ncbi:glycosyltransferase family 4 protein [Aureibaculum sp. 2210JD6-5]|uniref:glycosyltransferase n=1 Tax=Aureibaculum sp. 2210JD6-5 TaxID=3103957 RepID=UPI002AACD97F|nr:glycosyltransferase family 4 protein [Aureibaculum sp. 2210JD6-5]MDY7396485.1 glycosyltransferase family 4 protein [Aureibaculum sp. 2210JD6-5]
MVLFIGLVFPESTSTAAGSRMLQLLHFFLAENYKITFASAAQQTEYIDDLESLGVKKVTIKLNDSSFDEFIKVLQPEIVVFDRFITEEQFGWRVAENCPNAIRILDTEDLHCLRQARFEAFKKDETFELKQLNKLDITKREIASIYRCDLSLIISPYEYQLLINHFKIPKEILVELPFMLDGISQEDIFKKSFFEKRQDFISIGNFKHEPNWQSVLYLKKTIWPLIRKQIPNAKLLIYGSYPSQKVTDLHNENEGFMVMGRAEDAHKVISKAKVLLAPLQFGAGLKGKFIDAMLNGTPSVTTSFGAEGMHGDLPWNGFITDNPKAFADKAVELYSNKEIWLTSQQNGIGIINNIYLKEQLSEKLNNQIRKIQDDINLHRNNNFVGVLLQHHSFQSTKYLSRWIEAKNS